MQNARHFKRQAILLIFLSFLLTFPSMSLCAERIGIVYSETSANQFYDKFAYSQLFMAMQHQAMMAGIPFDVLAETDLTDPAKLSSYAALIIPAMEHTTNEAAIASALQTASNNGVGIISSGILLSTQATADLLGIVASGSINGLAAAVTAGDVSHPVMHAFTTNEQIIQYSAIWTNSYQPVSGQNAVTLAYITANNQVLNGVLATTKGGRNVHFANDQILGDCNLVWSALQWVVFGDQTPVALRLGRNRSIFIGRNDMDSSMYPNDLPLTDVPLLDLITSWKQAYNYIGSYYLNIGNKPNQGEYTDWQVSGPLFTQYLALGSEIGTHSYTHPDYTSQLTSSELEFEFNQSKLEIGTQLGIEVLGAAIPGTAETLDVDWQLNDYFKYVSGRASVIGSGYPCAFGYLTPDYQMIYFNLNLSPDFTLIDFLGYTPAEASQIWTNEYNALLNHAPQPIIHWLWHDYAPTMESPGHYSVEMFQNLLALAYNSGSEFATLADVQKRIKAFQAASLEVTETGGALTVNVAANDVGQFSLGIPSNYLIARVDNWYAYNEDKVFIPATGGQFIIRQGMTPNDLTHITSLPMRAKLLTLSGDGTELNFTFEGEGAVVATLNSALATGYNVQGADSTSLNGTTLTMNFNTIGTHAVTITLASGTNQAPVANAQSITTESGVALPIILTASDPNNDSLTMQVTSSPSNGTLSGTPPQLTYTSNAGFIGTDSFDFVANDGVLNSAPATVTITVKELNLPPVAESQSLGTLESTPLAITLTATDPNNGLLTMRVTAGPSNGTLSGTPPLLTYTANTGFLGTDSFEFVANDGLLDSSPATVTIAVSKNNQSPVADGQTLTTGESQPLAITLTASDPNNDPLTIRVTTNPIHGTLSGTPPSLTYTPNAGYSGNDSFDFVANDGLVDSSPATITITVTPADIFNYTSGITVDGDLSEWATLVSFGPDPDDITDTTMIDWREGWMAHDNTNFYLAIRNDTAISLSWASNIYLDTDSNIATGFNDGSALPIGADYLIQGSYLYHYSGNGSNWSWTAVTALSQASSGTNTELVIPRATIGNPNTLHLFFLGDNNAYASGAPLDLYPDQVLDPSGQQRFFAYTTSVSTNMPPVAQAQSLTTATTEALNITLTAADPNGDPVTMEVTTGPSNGTLTGTPPQVTYTPNSGFVGSDSFSFVASDGTLSSNPATVSITVTSGNGAVSNYTTGITVNGDLTDWSTLVSFGPDPDDITDTTMIDWREGWMAHDNTNFYLAIRNDTAFTLSWANNIYLDTDSNSASGYHNGSTFPIGAEYLIQGSYLYQYTGDGSSWSWNLVATLTQASSGTNVELVIPRATIGSPSTVRLIFFGDNSAYASGALLDFYPDQALDPSGQQRFFTYTTSVSTNMPPVAQDQTLTTAPGTALPITLAADDPNGDPVTMEVTTGPSTGTLTGTPPQVTYTPNSGFVGSDSFSFVASDGTLSSNPATVSITVTSGNGAVSNYTTGITVNGDLTDWSTLVSFDPDPDDITDTTMIDWREGWMAHDDTNIYLAIRNDTAIALSWAYNVYLDTDGNQTTGFFDGSFPIGAEYLIQGSSLYQYTGDGSSWSWNFVATLTQAVSGTNVELVIPRATIGSPSTVRLIFFGDNSAYASGAPLDLYPDQALEPSGSPRFFTYQVN